MTQTEVTKEEIMAVYPKVAETMADGAANALLTIPPGVVTSERNIP